jgi:hypothetical protein
MLSASDSFRSECVMAWSLLSFSSDGAERERRRLLTQSLVSRARLHVRHGRRADASADLRQAAAVGGVRCLHLIVPTAIVAALPNRAVRRLVQTLAGR